MDKLLEYISYILFGETTHLTLAHFVEQNMFYFLV